jgi:hypothetical protein
MKAITVNEVVSKPKASPKAPKEATSHTELKTPNAVIKALRVAATSPRSWTVITCVFLAISGGLRFVRDWGFSAKLEAARPSPFPLEELPKGIGPWRMLSEGDLDPEIARVAGASDHINRNYMNDKTGEVVSVLVLYGLAYALHGHTAEICYPAAGYTRVNSPISGELKLADLDKVVGYRGAYFAKKKSLADEYFEVIYSFRFVDEWTADPAPKWKMFRTHPGMYKVQIERAVSEFSVETSPSLPLLEGFAKEIEKRLSKSSAQSGKTAGADQATPKKI